VDGTALNAFYEEVVAIWIIVNEVTLGASGFSLRVMN